MTQGVVYIAGGSEVFGDSITVKDYVRAKRAVRQSADGGGDPEFEQTSGQRITVPRERIIAVEERRS